MAPQPARFSPPDEIPPIPTWTNLRIFLWGALWTVAGAVAPSAVIVYDWLQRWDDPPDWVMVGRMAGASALLALMGYWRKHKALLSTPPPPPNQE